MPSDDFSISASADPARADSINVADVWTTENHSPKGVSLSKPRKRERKVQRLFFCLFFMPCFFRRLAGRSVFVARAPHF